MTTLSPTPAPTAPPITPQKRPQALAITALVLGIAAFLTAFIGVPGIVLGATAVVFGILALKKSQPKGLSVTGVVIGSLGLIGGIIMLVITALFMSALGTGIDVLETGDLSGLEDLGATFEEIE